MLDERYKADGCLLLAPAYPGSTRGEDSATANRARELRISCWTVNQLAQFIEIAESRQFTARDVLDIVLNHFSPNEVTEALDKLFMEPVWDTRALYQAILKALRQLEDRLPDSPRTVDMVAVTISNKPEFSQIGKEDVKKAVEELASASQGAMTFRRETETIVLHVSYDELERRLGGLTRHAGEPRKRSSFRQT